MQPIKAVPIQEKGREAHLQSSVQRRRQCQTKHCHQLLQRIQQESNRSLGEPKEQCRILLETFSLQKITIFQSEQEFIEVKL